MSNPISDVQWLERYQSYLEKVRGLSNETQRSYLHAAKRFLQSLSGALSEGRLEASSVVEFVKLDAGQRKGHGPESTTARTRSFLRFLITEGAIPAGFEEAVPTIRCYRQANLPAYLSDAEVEQVLSFFKNDSDRGIRNYALLLLLSRLALRISEAAALKLDDIDWRNGLILIDVSKTKCERQLPLPQDVGDAILRYIRLVRPRIPERHLFLQPVSPFGAYRAGSLGKAVSRMLVSAGLNAPRGAHLFRHAAATKMVNKGASFKEIADLLGHESLVSTAVYAKLDLVRLSEVALPWPGGMGDE